ncbi:MAG: hypothetical protein R3Y11_09315 [Pseudomonadota bacterium]
MGDITLDSVVIFLIIVGALAFLIRKFTLPTTRCGCGSSCGGCGGNTHRSHKRTILADATEGTDGTDGTKTKVNKCYMLDDVAKRNAK